MIKFFIKKKPRSFDRGAWTGWSGAAEELIGEDKAGHDHKSGSFILGRIA